MILGRITGKTTSTHFSFLVEKPAKKFGYVQVMHRDYDYVLCQIYELEKDTQRTIAKCLAIGYRDDQGRIRLPRSPFEPGTEVLQAEDSFIKSIIQLGKAGAYIGKLEGKNIDVHLDMNKMLTKHVAVMAKSGAGKSYTVAVLLEEIIEKKIPLLIIDPHGEYSFMSQPNDSSDDLERMPRFGIKPKGYSNEIQEYADTEIVQHARPLKLNDSFTVQELLHILPAKLSNSQQALLYSAIKNLKDTTLTGLIFALEQEESSQKYQIMSVIEYLKGLNIFAPDAMAYNELVQSGRASIINLKGIPPDIQAIIVYKVLNDLFEERKKGKIPPFFAVIEEAHNFVPERGFGEPKSSVILRTIASEGRKFGMGLCIITQRPARVEKNVLSQMTTQIIMKVTNPNDLKAISQSVEGITAETEYEIKNLPIGSALVTGLVDMPLFITVRPRKSKHGGDAVDMLSQEFMEELVGFEEKEMLPVVMPKVTQKDIRLMEDEVQKITTTLIPAYLFHCQGDDRFNLLVEMMDGQVVKDIDTLATASLPRLDRMSPKELFSLKHAYRLKEFTVEEFIKKTGSGLDAQSALAALHDKGFLDMDKKRFKVTDNFILSNLEKFRSFAKIEFKKVNYDEKKKPRANLDKVKDHLSRFTTVLDQKECYIVKYKQEKVS
ncbi:MAG: ATP-binding protein [Nanoarchaeota archaeon]|nr:ATP-binding protein [Nanoarchaeota archaeon]